MEPLAINNYATIGNKIEQNKSQYNLNRKKAKTWPLLSENVGKYEFLTGQDILSEKNF